MTTHLTVAPGHLLLLPLALKINEGLLGAAWALQLLLSCWGDALLGGFHQTLLSSEQRLPGPRSLV